MQDTNNYQRLGAISNAHVGRDFESIAYRYFNDQGIPIIFNYPLNVGANLKVKKRNFDLGSDEPAVIIECKSLNWTASGKVPSAKITTLNESMYYFYLAPQSYRKIMFVLSSRCEKRGMTLMEYYIKRYGHLIPSGVEIIEYDELTKNIIKLDI